MQYEGEDHITPTKSEQAQVVGRQESFAQQNDQVCSFLRELGAAGGHDIEPEGYDAEQVLPHQDHDGLQVEESFSGPQGEEEEDLVHQDRGRRATSKDHVRGQRCSTEALNATSTKSIYFVLR